MSDPSTDAGAIWVCNCGSTVHYCHADGRIECAACETITSDCSAAWRERLPATPKDPEPMPPDAFKVVSLQSVDLFYRRRIKAEATDEPAIAVVCLYSDGSQVTFLDHKTSPDPEWLKRQLDLAHERFAQSILLRSSDDAEAP